VFRSLRRSKHLTRIASRRNSLRRGPSAPAEFKPRDGSSASCKYLARRGIWRSTTSASGDTTRIEFGCRGTGRDDRAPVASLPDSSTADEIRAPELGAAVHVRRREQLTQTAAEVAAAGIASWAGIAVAASNFGSSPSPQIKKHDVLARGHTHGHPRGITMSPCLRPGLREEHHAAFSGIPVRPIVAACRGRFDGRNINQVGNAHNGRFSSTPCWSKQLDHPARHATRLIESAKGKPTAHPQTRLQHRPFSITIRNANLDLKNPADAANSQPRTTRASTSRGRAQKGRRM